MRYKLKLSFYWILSLLFFMFFSKTLLAQPQESIIKPVTEVPLLKIELQVDKTTFKGDEKIKLTGKVPEGYRVNFIEITSKEKVQVSRLDRKDFKFYLSKEIPAFYQVWIADDYVAKIDKNGTVEEKPIKEIYQKYAQNKKWKIGEFLKESNANVAFITPVKEITQIDVWKTTVLRAIIGSRGIKLEPLTDKKEISKEAARLIQTRFRNFNKIFRLAQIKHNPDGTFEAEITIPGSAPKGEFTVLAVASKEVKSEPIKLIHDISFPTVYFPVAGTSTNVFGPLALAFIICTFGVIMGAGGGFILNPLLILIYGLPHGVVAGSVMPTVLFSQASGIYNYSKIGFINWKLGIGVGIFMLLGGFIGPLLNQFVTLDEYKFIFGIILLILAVLLVWQTTPGYLEKNKKERAILQEYMKRAKEAKEKKSN
ncbi:sulfite exporter TauE/SafE family protein [Thermodesulfobacterium sp. TA1]|uniref:sulfite exporter TauE/SafE family protein n=1 Tax=Thermodesulfobacterium sp. TA1 TaxID=2234087 RepID=UPI0012324CE5|nr:sulfite exporter TauE/SafE family protein [Thermodesulfobacterium sp. TA1]QER42599.1 sulfite exporter TauE/SafE family protein [Thermodesulfobacterium sp. TA1]